MAKCEVCGVNKGTQIHHLMGVRTMKICKPCHSWVHGYRHGVGREPREPKLISLKRVGKRFVLQKNCLAYKISRSKPKSAI